MFWKGSRIKRLERELSELRFNVANLRTLINHKSEMYLPNIAPQELVFGIQNKHQIKDILNMMLKHFKLSYKIDYEKKYLEVKKPIKNKPKKKTKRKEK